MRTWPTLFVLLLITPALQARPLSHREQLASLALEALQETLGACSLQISKVEIVWEEQGAVSEYLRSIFLTVEPTLASSGDEVSLFIRDPQLILEYLPGPGQRNKPYRRKLNLHMRIVVRHGNPAETILDTLIDKTGIDHLSRADLHGLLEEPIPVQATGLDELRTGSPAWKIVFTVTSLLLVTGLFYLRSA